MSGEANNGGAFRLPVGGRIDRARPIILSHDGQFLGGFAGDSVAATLLAHGKHLVARSFKYHRPRGIVAAGVEEPNALLTVGSGARREPNVAATVLELHEGLQTRTQNAWPSVEFDLMAINGLLSPFFVAGFYYKTFMGPTRKAWMFYEHFIRKAAGLGEATTQADPDRYDQHHGFTDVLVVGSGPAGLSAALGAARAGLDVVLVEQDHLAGGSLLAHPIGSAPALWLAGVLADLRDTGRVRILTRATAFGLYDGNTVGIAQHTEPGAADPKRGMPRQRLHVMRAKQVVMACGALERPLVFAGNDLPGVMLAGAVGAYVHRYAVMPGRTAVFAVNNDAAYDAAIALARAGASVCLADLRAQAGDGALQQAREAGIDVRLATAVTQAQGGQRVERCLLAPYDIDTGVVTAAGTTMLADLVAMSGGWTPTVHLSSHRGIKPVYRNDLAAFVPGGFDRDHHGAGAMVGSQDLAAAITSGWQVAQQVCDAMGAALDASVPVAPATPPRSMAFVAVPPIPSRRRRGKAFVDFQNDVTVDDIHLAHREGYRSVEHLKRYTTLGMGTDQGKTSNLNALAIMAVRRELGPQAMGTTTFRPPFTPVTIGVLAGRSVRGHLAAVRRTAMHDWHEEHGGDMMEAGAWKRPLWYHGHGATLQELREDGMVMDDGTTSRIAETQFFMTTTTAQAGKVMSHLEFLLQVVWPQLRVTVASVSDQWAAMSMAGPRSREVLMAAFPHIDGSTEALGHMGLLDTIGTGALAGVPLRIIRLTFSGELAYEVYTHTHFGRQVWDHLLEAGKPWNLRPYGLEALGSLRIEKGHVVGSEMDGRTTLGDMGMARMASTIKPFWGGALATSENLVRDDRPTLVGLEAVNANEPPNNGAILFFAEDPVTGHGRGHVTSTTYSQSVGKAIALGLLQGGLRHLGKEVIAASPVHGRQYRLKVVDPCFLDQPGERYRA